MMNFNYSIKGKFVTSDQLSANQLFGCEIDKTITGCGLSTLFLNEPNVVLVVPTVSIIDSKIKIIDSEAGIGEYNGKPIVFVKAGVDVTKMFNYINAIYKESTSLKNNINITIISTYDGLVKVIKALGKHISDFHLVIDEYHGFVLDTFRERATNFVINNARYFKDLTTMTATPARFASTEVVFGIKTNKVKLMFDYKDPFNNVQVLYAKDSIKVLLGAINASSAETKLCFINDTLDIKCIAESLSDKNVYILTGESKKYRFEDLATVNDINKAEVILCTKKGYEAWDYTKTADVDVFAIVNPKHFERMITYAQLKQCVGRARLGFNSCTVVYQQPRSNKMINEAYKEYLKTQNEIQARANAIDDFLEDAFKNNVKSNSICLQRCWKANIHNQYKICFHKGFEEYIKCFTNCTILKNDFEKTTRAKRKSAFTVDKEYALKKDSKLSNIKNPTILAAIELFGKRTVAYKGEKKLKMMLDSIKHNIQDIKTYLQVIDSNKSTYTSPKQIKDIYNEFSKFAPITYKTFLTKVLDVTKVHTKKGNSYKINSVITDTRWVETFLDFCPNC